MAEFSRAAAAITEPALLIRINQSYRQGMSALELYEATRGVWRLGPKRERAHIALAVHRGVVLEVYEIQNWHRATTTTYATRTFSDPRVKERWEFTGAVAEEAIRRKYVGKSVTDYLPPHSQAPVLYVNID
jgi:hypothetical protein